ncbi:hypothetical protein Q8A67_018644 [Cirrhinus molitorella]|uniref:Uncharacterized protein n=1 Tax=Cirrhinus molitorella TaxID=172907 RepID=A0AA88PGP5_9TELE|nr:hypothetical protein Q8A67_018644 [Cirrhinus molitorella]
MKLIPDHGYERKERKTDLWGEETMTRICNGPVSWQLLPTIFRSLYPDQAQKQHSTTTVPQGALYRCPLISCNTAGLKAPIRTHSLNVCGLRMRPQEQFTSP